MTITVNDQARDVPEGTSVADLLASLGLKPQAMVVQCNGDILERERYGATVLHENDALELVRFVGGG